MDKEYKVVCVSIYPNSKDILDIEKIFAEDIETATRLSRDIQIAEITAYLKDEDKKEEEILEIIQEYYYDAYVDTENKVGLVQSGENNVLFVLGEENEWWQYICDMYSEYNWDDVIAAEWEDFVSEILRKEAEHENIKELC